MFKQNWQDVSELSRKLEGLKLHLSMAVEMIDRFSKIQDHICQESDRLEAGLLSKKIKELLKSGRKA